MKTMHIIIHSRFHSRKSSCFKNFLMELLESCTKVVGGAGITCCPEVMTEYCSDVAVKLLKTKTVRTLPMFRKEVGILA